MGLYKKNAAVCKYAVINCHTMSQYPLVLTVSCFLLSCQLSGQTKRTPRVPQREGIYGSGRNPPSAPSSPFAFPTVLFLSKQSHGRLSVNRQQRRPQLDVRQYHTHGYSSFTTSEISTPLPFLISHNTISVHTCFVISS